MSAETVPLKQRIRLLCNEKDSPTLHVSKIWLTAGDIAELERGDVEVLGTKLAAEVKANGWTSPTLMGLQIESRAADATRVE